MAIITLFLLAAFLILFIDFAGNKEHKDAQKARARARARARTKANYRNY